MDQHPAVPNLRWRLLPLSEIVVPREYVRSVVDKAKDKALAEGIRLGMANNPKEPWKAINQPLVVVPEPSQGKRFLLVKGTRTYAAAEANGLERVPVIVNHPPADLSPKAFKDWRDRLRWLLTPHQDLTASQTATVYRELLRVYSITQKQLAALLHVDPATVTNILRIQQCAPAIVELVDRGELSLHQATALADLKPAAQVKVYRALRHDFEEKGGAKLRAIIRKRFPVARHPEMYEAPDAAVVQRRSKQKGALIRKRRTPVSKSELHRLENDLELLAIEEENNREMVKHADLLIRLVGPIHRAVSASDEAMDHVAKRYPQHIDALARFSELV